MMNIKESEQISKAVEPLQLVDGLNDFDGRFLLVGDVDKKVEAEFVVGYEFYIHNKVRPIYIVLGEGWCEDKQGKEAMLNLLNLFNPSNRSSL